MKRTTLISVLLGCIIQFGAWAQNDVDKFFKNASKVQKDKAVVEEEKPKADPKKEIVKPKPPKETKPATQPSGVRIQSPHPNIQIKWIKTNRINNKVILDFTICNTSNKDVEIGICGGGNSSAFDNVGNKYDKTMTNAISSAVHTSYYYNSLFPSNVPIKCQIVIDEIEPDATLLSRINWILSCSKLEVHSKPIVVSNLSIKGNTE